LSLDQLQPRLQAALARATFELLAARVPAGHWVGKLSSSALSTATAVTALAVAQRESEVFNLKSHIGSGTDWLARHVNTDGGWGDTPDSVSNLSTTTLCWAAFGAAKADVQFTTLLQRAEQWLADHINVPHSAFRIPHSPLASAIVARYGKDRTFSVPILTMCALAGRLGGGREAWQHVIPLPFELAACPHSWFAALRLPVVSYALPALIAIGQARHVHCPSRNPVARLARQLTRQRTLRVLARIQPSSGGFLEATPLTSFVTLSLAGSGQVKHPVTQRGVEFLKASQRPEGSWPIDTNLATWISTLAVNALPMDEGRWPIGPAQPLEPFQREIAQWKSAVRRWLLAQQYRAEHPYTHAAPGGWAWTDLPGGVPDADDTSGALLALRHLGAVDEEVLTAATAGVRWLLDLQNADGGIPTFCRGWGTLPFDRSSADITAHAVRAWAAWHDELPASLRARANAATDCALRFLRRKQRIDGSWVPLWFGNQSAPKEENPTYGTARVLLAFADERMRDRLSRAGIDAVDNGARWLLEAQNADGSWGGALRSQASVEETALAVEALAAVLAPPGLSLVLSREDIARALAQGTRWLIERVESSQWTQPAPIGFYFAKLWYSERLYPLIFTVGALGRVAELTRAKAGVNKDVLV